MAAPMFAQPVTADELTYSETALKRASGVILKPVRVVHGLRRSDELREPAYAGTDQLHILDQTGPRQRATGVSRET
jgi:hypothetical protein